MPEIIRDCEQGSERWHELRVGSIGGTGINSVLSKGKGKMRQTLLYKLAGEILIGKPSDNIDLPQFRRGLEYESIARSYYEFLMDCEVEQVAMIKSDTPRRHDSPDGLVGDDGGIEIKTRAPHIYIELCETQKIPIADVRQCQNFLEVSRRKFIDYVVYCVPEMPSKPAWIKRIYPDAKMFASIRIETQAFLAELEELVKRMA